MTDVLMPALSPTMEEGTLAKWHVKVGDNVKSGDVIAEIETDKATMEVEAVDRRGAGAVGSRGTEEVKVNTPIARLSGDGADASPPPGGAGAGGGGNSPQPEAKPAKASEPQVAKSAPVPASPHPQPLPLKGEGAKSASSLVRWHAASPRTPAPTWLK
ncbi:MAG: biotin/lipoyl-containing protein [Caulobacteraceae bacterium]